MVGAAEDIDPVVGPEPLSKLSVIGSAEAGASTEGGSHAMSPRDVARGAVAPGQSPALLSERGRTLSPPAAAQQAVAQHVNQFEIIELVAGESLRGQGRCAPRVT